MTTNPSDSIIRNKVTVKLYDVERLYPHKTMIIKVLLHPPNKSSDQTHWHT